MLRYLSVFFVSALLLTSYGCLSSLNLDKGLDAMSDAYQSLTMSPEDLTELGKQTAKEMDAQANVAPSSNKYAQRLNKITKGLKSEDGLALNFKVYLTSDINAFALPDGSVRVYSGLMDLMTDNKLFFVIGHEIGHVKEGHAANRFKLAYATSAARKAADAAGGSASAISSSQLAELGEQVIHAQFSQSQETASDEYGLKLIQKYNKPTSAAISALDKLAALGGKSSILSTHPGASERAKHLQKILDKQSK